MDHCPSAYRMIDEWGWVFTPILQHEENLDFYWCESTESLSSLWYFEFLCIKPTNKNSYVPSCRHSFPVIWSVDLLELRLQELWTVQTKPTDWCCVDYSSLCYPGSVSLPQAVLPTDRCIPSSLSCEVSVIIFLHDLRIYLCPATFVHYLNAWFMILLAGCSHGLQCWKVTFNLETRNFPSYATCLWALFS